MRSHSRWGRSFRTLRAAAIGTRFGDTARTGGVAVVAATLTRDPFLVALVTAMGFLPWLLFGLHAGALVDRLDKRRAFLRADVFRCAVAAGACVLAFTGHLGIWGLVVTAFVLTAAQTISDSCFTSLLPSTVAPGELGRANARLSVGQSSATLAGGPAGGFLGAFGAAWPFLVNVLTFGAAAGLVSSTPRALDRDRPREHRTTSSRALTADVGAGFRVVRRDPVLLASVCTVSASNVCNGLNTAALPLLALYEVDLPAAAFGLVMATTAVAMMLGNVLAPPLAARAGDRTAGLVALLPKLPGFLLVTTATTTPQLFAGAALLGLGSGLWNVHMSTAVLAASPPAYRGRVVALTRTVATAGTPLGAVCAGVVATAFGIRAAPGLALVVSVATVVLFARLTARRAVARASGSTMEEGDDLSPVCSPR